MKYGVVATAKVKGRWIDFNATESVFGVTEETGLTTLKNMAVGAPYIIEVNGKKGKFVPLESHRNGRIVDIVISDDSTQLMATTEPRQPEKSPLIVMGSQKELTLQQTIDRLREDGQTKDADYLQSQLAYAKKHMESRNWSFIFGSCLLYTSPSPRDS